MVLIFILFSVGLFTLGWRLRHPRNKASAPAKPVYAPPRQYTAASLLSLDIRPAEQGPGARKLRFDESLHQWRLSVQLDEERLWFFRYLWVKTAS
ncbi:MAG: hypothetical protein MSO56_02985 [Clostridiales bacterium]|nr:hypothetical protein [Clostridiales bacterium]